MSAPKIHI